VNYRAAANLVEDLSAMLRHSWNSSLFAEIDPTTATGVIFGVEGPAHLFTTTQVDLEDHVAIVVAILELQNRGYIIEVRKNIFRIA